MKLKAVISAGAACGLAISLFLASPVSSGAESLKEGANEAAKAISEGANEVGDYFNDATLTTAIKSKYLSTKGLDSFDISVTTVDGIVALGGQVDNQAQSSLAEELAKNTNGVKKVINNIIVRK